MMEHENDTGPPIPKSLWGSEPTRSVEEEPVAPSGNEEAGPSSHAAHADLHTHHSMTAGVEATQPVRQVRTDLNEVETAPRRTSPPDEVLRWRGPMWKGMTWSGGSCRN